jgi:hypothetical protein
MGLACYFLFLLGLVVTYTTIYAALVFVVVLCRDLLGQSPQGLGETNPLKTPTWLIPFNPFLKNLAAGASYLW